MVTIQGFAVTLASTILVRRSTFAKNDIGRHKMVLRVPRTDVKGLRQILTENA